MDINTPYYIIKPAVDTKETGSAYPAVESYEDYNFDAPNSVYKLKYGAFPDFVPDIRFKLAKAAKLCDMMGQATIAAPGFLVSEQFKQVISAFNIVPHKFYPATIESNGIFYNYFWMHIVIDDLHDFINYKMSDFYLKKFSANLGKIDVESKADLIEKRIGLPVNNIITFNTISIAPNDYDLFALHFQGYIYINEKLKYSLLKEKLNGIAISITDKLQLMT